MPSEIDDIVADIIRKNRGEEAMQIRNTYLQQQQAAVRQAGERAVAGGVEMLGPDAQHQALLRAAAPARTKVQVQGRAGEAARGVAATGAEAAIAGQDTYGASNEAILNEPSDRWSLLVYPPDGAEGCELVVGRSDVSRPRPFPRSRLSERAFR